MISEQISRNMGGSESTEMTLLLRYKSYTNELEDYLSKKILSVNDCIHVSRTMRKPVLSYANNKGADQLAHLRSLISTFTVRCLDSIIPSFYVRNFKPLPSFCGCAGRFES